jgi:hypothetical protein
MTREMPAFARQALGNGYPSDQPFGFHLARDRVNSGRLLWVGNCEFRGARNVLDRGHERTGRMASRGADTRWSHVLLLVVIGAALAAEARAEDVSERAKVASSRTRLRGASGLRVIPDGLLSVPPGYDTPFSVEGLHLVDDGRAAIVFVTGHPWAYDTGTRRVVAAYRVRLEGETAPELLFSEVSVCRGMGPRRCRSIPPRSASA